MLAVLVSIMVLLGPGAAKAEPPPTPRIEVTNPISSLLHTAPTVTPFVAGDSELGDGVIVGVVAAWSGSGLRDVPGARGAAEDREIVIYGQAGCAGASIGRGSAGDFEEGGIQVLVPADAQTELSARQVDETISEPDSGCSEPFPYWEGNAPGSGGSSGGTADGQDGGGGGSAQGGASNSASGGSVGSAVATTGKPEAPRIHLKPGGTANDNTPLVAGSAPGAGSVLVFASDSCGGSLVARGSAADLAAGLTVQVADNTTTTFSAFAVGGQRSSCSAPVTYTEDSTAPKTRVTMGPGVKTRRSRAVFRFSDVTGDPPGTSFFCKVNRKKWKPCSSPLRLKRLRTRRYVVRVRAIDLAGNAEKRGAKRIFSVVRKH